MTQTEPTRAAEDFGAVPSFAGVDLNSTTPGGDLSRGPALERLAQAQGQSVD